MADGEPLRDFMKRFGQAVLQVENYSIDAILQIFKSNINPGTPFFQSLAKKPPATMDELYKRADKYAMLEDDLRAASQHINVAGRPSIKERPKPQQTPPAGPGTGVEGGTNPRPPPSVPPLNVTFEQLVPIVMELPGFKWPEPMRSHPDKRDRKRKCSYHKEHGHTTEQCVQFRFMLRKLLKDGYLNQYLQTTGPPSRSSVAPEEAARGVIQVIHASLLHAPVDSRRVRRKLSRIAAISKRREPPAWAGVGDNPPIDAPISFPPLDKTRVVAPHDDALVLMLNIGHFDVRRILVDPGSSTDLIQLSAVRQMGYAVGELPNPGRVLSGFNGAITKSLGNILLPVRAGPVIQTVEFSVVEDLDPYNVILGRTWLHSMKAVPSTYHQMVSYMTKLRQVDILGNQSTSRQCFQIAVSSQACPPLDDTNAQAK